VVDLLARQVDRTDIDVDEDPTVPSQGDQTVLAVDLFHADSKVGEESSICTTTRT
jgi:hypothetical protein